MNVPKIPVGRIYNAVRGGIDEMAALALGRRMQAVPTDAAGLACYLVDQMGIQNRGAAAFHCDVTTVILVLACNLDGRPPRYWDELLARLDFHRLAKAYNVDVLCFTEEQVEEVAIRCEALRYRQGGEPPDPSQEHEAAVALVERTSAETS